MNSKAALWLVLLTYIKMTNATVKRLFDEMSRNNFDAFTHYYHESCNMVYGYCLLETDNPAIAEKVVEAVYKQLWHSRRQLPAIQGKKLYILLLAREHMLRLS